MDLSAFSHLFINNFRYYLDVLQAAAQPYDSTAVCLDMRNLLKGLWFSRTITGLVIAGGVMCLSAKSLGAEVIVRVAPPPVRVETVPPPPSHYHVWDPGHWRWDGRGYVWVPGHYINNPHRYARWIPGHWVNRGGGWFWVEGHWRH